MIKLRIFAGVKMKENKLVDFFNKLDRSIFIDNKNKKWANLDRPLPIGYGQTISQPSLVLEMTSQLKLDKNCSVLEIGTGSGYQTCFLAQFAKNVYTVEIISELSSKAKERLNSLEYNNIFFKVDDGSKGWEEFAPYDRIIVTAAAEKMPSMLIEQLKQNGIMIAPIGPRGYQDLSFITKDENGSIKAESIGKVTFVEMKGKYGWIKDR